MKPIWILLGLLIIVLIIILNIWWEWQTIPSIVASLPIVRETYIFEAKDEYRVFSLPVHPEALISGIEDVAHHRVERNNHEFFLKKNIPYTFVVEQEGRGQLWKRESAQNVRS